MKWSELFDSGHLPSELDIEGYLGDANILWNELTSYIEEAWQVKPHYSFSKDSLQMGWNVRYKKSGKSLCTLYPMPGYFIVLVVVGSKEEAEVKRGMDAGLFTAYVKALYDETAYSRLGRWLMIETKDDSVLKDILRLLETRVRPRKTAG